MFGLLTIFSGIKSFKTLSIYIDKGNVSFIGIKEKFSRTVNLFKNEKYTIKEEVKPFFYKGKRILWLTPKSHINLDLKIDTSELLCDSETANLLIDEVVVWKLTNPVKAGGIGGLFDLLANNWIIIIFIIIGYYLYSTGALNSIIGI